MVRVGLRDDPFERIAALLPGKLSDPERTATDNRRFLQAVLCQRFTRWSRCALWYQVFAQLAQDADFEEVFIDITMIRAHPHAAGAPQKKSATARALAGRAEYEDSRLKRWRKVWDRSPDSA